jgi:hypothetical protein
MLDRPTSSVLSRRKLLTLAIAAHRDAIEKREMAWRAADRAWNLKNEATAILNSFGDLDSDITTYRAEKIKAWSLGNGEGSSTSRDLPPDLEAAVNARDLATADAASAAAVHKALKADAETADEVVRRAEAALGDAAQWVMAETAEEVADELARVQALTNALRYRLDGFVAVLKVPLSARAKELAQYPREPFLVPRLNPKQREMDNIFGYHRRLLTDPNSELDCSS